MAEFDWYQATVREPVNDVLEALQDLSGCSRVRHVRGVQGYGFRTLIEDDASVMGEVWHGGSHQYPHVKFSGEETPRGVRLLRSAFPVHSVSRLDVREDFDGADTFDQFQAVLLKVAVQHRIKVECAGDHVLTKQGRTLYLGARTSGVRIRLYDKAAELRAKFHADPVRLARVPEHLTRLEAQIKPKDSGVRRVLAQASPDDLWGCSGWLGDVWRDVSGVDVQPIRITKPYRQSDDQRAYAYLLAQYGGVLRRMCSELGSWSEVGERIGSDIAERDTHLTSHCDAGEVH